MQDRHDHIAHLLAGRWPQRATYRLHDVHRALARIGEQHTIDVRNVHAFGQAPRIRDQSPLRPRKLPDNPRPCPRRCLTRNMERLHASIGSKRAVERVVVHLECFGPGDAAVERDGMADGILLHRLAQRHQRRQHLGLDLLVPWPLVRPHKDILADHLGHFLTRHENRHDLVVAQDRRLVFQRVLEAQQVKRVAVDSGIVHAQNFVALALVPALGRRHEQPPPHRQILVVEQMRE